MAELTARCVKSLVVNNGAGRVITARQCLSIFGGACAHICYLRTLSLQNVHTLYYPLVPRREIAVVNFAAAILNASDSADACHSSYNPAAQNAVCLLRLTGLFN